MIKKFLQFFRPTKAVSLCVPVFARGMSLAQFQSVPSNVAEMRRIFKLEAMADALGVLREGTPRGYPIRGGEISQEQALIELGRKEGYYDCLDLLLAMANYPASPHTEIVPDWGAARRMKEEGFPTK